LQSFYGKRGGERLRERLQIMPNTEYQRLLRLPPGAVRKALVATDGGGIDRTLDKLLSDTSDAALAELVADLGGHALRLLGEALVDARGAPLDLSPGVLDPGSVRPWARRAEPAAARGSRRDGVGRRRGHHAPGGVDQPEGGLLSRGAAQPVRRRATGRSVEGV